LKPVGTAQLYHGTIVDNRGKTLECSCRPRGVGEAAPAPSPVRRRQVRELAPVQARIEPVSGQELVVDRDRQISQHRIHATWRPCTIPITWRASKPRTASAKSPSPPPDAAWPVTLTDTMTPAPNSSPHRSFAARAASSRPVPTKTSRPAAHAARPAQPGVPGRPRCPLIQYQKAGPPTKRASPMKWRAFSNGYAKGNSPHAAGPALDSEPSVSRAQGRRRSRRALYGPPSGCTWKTKNP